MGERAAAALSVVLILGLPPGALGCPQPCACYLPTEVHCTFRSLAAVPAGIAKHVERVNFGCVWRFIANSFLFSVRNPGMLRIRAAYWDLCAYFLSGIAEMGGDLQVLCFKHCSYRHGESLSVTLMFQRKVTVVFEYTFISQCQFFLANGIHSLL